jgi:AdoMet-dependent heme synthase
MHPHGATSAGPALRPQNELRLIAWEMTRSCNLNCRHCRAAAEKGPYTGELSTEECEKLMDNVAGFAKPIIIMTGGEPMLRPDIFHLAEYGTKLGLRMVMAPCGKMLTVESCNKLKAAGIQRISLSIDGATAESHDAFRRVPGAFQNVMDGIAAANAAGLEFQVNTTVTKLNIKEVPAIFDMAIKLGAVSFHPFLLVPTGRGKELADQEIPPDEYERVLNWIYEHRSEAGITMKPTCAPHYYRILRQREKAAGRIVKPETHGLDAMTKGCLGGQGFAFISHMGVVQICGFLDKEAGNIRKNNYDFQSIWENSPLFHEMRNLDGYHGRCGVCEYRKVCGGCRARAYETTGDYLNEEPYCVYEPTAQQKTGSPHA